VAFRDARPSIAQRFKHSRGIDLPTGREPTPNGVFSDVHAETHQLCCTPIDRLVAVPMNQYDTRAFRTGRGSAAPTSHRRSPLSPEVGATFHIQLTHTGSLSYPPGKRTLPIARFCRFRALALPYWMEAGGTGDISPRARKPMLTQDQQNSPPKKATATACAKGGAVHVSFASNHLKLRLCPTVVSITPDDAMALSIELQKAAIDARVSEAPPPPPSRWRDERPRDAPRVQGPIPRGAESCRSHTRTHSPVQVWRPFRRDRSGAHAR
jgi:hypothetical protein